jgi:hypothetical protein
MSAEVNRKEAIREYKMRRVSRGVFAVRCTVTSHVWVDSSPNLDGAKNGAWFQLHAGNYCDKTLQSEWNTHGENAFQFEILETLDDDVISLAVPDLLKEKKSQWAAQLGAKAV